ncbi:MAG TPA: prolyl oligopeptidase family serine peptidase [Thermoanaerobaculia bacterium]|jgi:dipeptidyl aminopeptidase/acylaminoacyl peptidase|nr:prolyl oligopeptidase family serine peptidase [Thermoanaerobaculia bacterium]
MKRIAIALLFAVIALAAAAQQFDLSIDNIMRGPGLYGWTPEDVRWSPDGQHVYFSWKLYTDTLEHDRDTYVVNRDGSGLRKLSDDEKKDAPPANAQWTRDKHRGVYLDDADVYVWDSATNKRRALTQTNDVESAPQFTFDETRVTFVRANNVFAIDLANGSITQLTNIVAPDDKGSNVTLWDDAAKKGTASQEYIKAEERKLLDIVDRKAKKREEDEAKRKREHPIKPFKLDKKQTVVNARLSPDGKTIVLVINNESEKAKKTIVPNYITEAVYTDTIPGREKVGDALLPSRVAVVSATNGEVKWFDHGMKPLPAAEPQKAVTSATAEEQGKASEQKTEKSAEPKEREVNLRAPVWSEDGKHAFVVVRSSDNKDAWIMEFDPATAKGRTIVTMHDDAWLRFADAQSFGWANNDTIYYLSEATGFMHLYEVPVSGGAPKQLTSGKWEVDSAVLSDDKKSFYLTTSEESPFVRHVYRIPVAGGTSAKLTTMDGNNEAVVSPDGNSIADVYSYTNKPPELYVSSKRVTTSPAPDFANFKWLDVPIVRVPARDGVEVPARIYKPANWKGGHAVIFVHGAGYLQNVNRFWSSYAHEYMFHHLLMSKGYLVLDIDYRGSRGYGRDWRTAIYRHMGGKDLEDNVDAAKWLVKTHGVDPKRIGIYGGSYGGFITLMAMFTTPDVFATGAALRPVTDWAAYNHPYTSNILNLPQTDAEAYRKSSPIYFAQGLKGHLLICHGMVDTNVHFQDSVRLAQRLIELRKTNWEIAPYPVENHGFVEPTSWADEYKRILKLFDAM